MTEHPPNAEQSNNSDGWPSCPEGELVQHVRGVKQVATRQRLKTIAFAASIFLLAIAGTQGLLWYMNQHSGENNWGNITCSEVVPLLPQYVANDLPTEQHDQITEHLAHCEMCATKYEELETAQLRHTDYASASFFGE